MSYQRIGLAALLSVPLALLMTKSAPLPAQTLELILGSVFIGTFAGTAEEGRRFKASSLLPALAAGAVGALTLAFLAYAYDHMVVAEAPSIPLLSGGLLSFTRNPVLSNVIAIYGAAEVVTVAAAIAAKEPLATMVARVANVDPRRVKNWFIGITGAAAAIGAFIKFL